MFLHNYWSDFVTLLILFLIGIAEGLVYLHENTKTRIIRRDIKDSNILLDSSLWVKIADFGLDRSFQEDESHAIVRTLLVILFFNIYIIATKLVLTK